MPNLPPFFNGKINGILTLTVSDITWYKNDVKCSYVQFEWTGSQEKHKLSTSIYSKITYDIRTSYKSFLNYLSTCTLKCTVKNYENKTIAHASIQNLLVVAQDNQLVKTLPLLNNERTVGSLKLYFNFQTFNDNSFDNVIKSLKQFGIQNKMLGILNDKDLYDSEVLKNKNNLRFTSSSSVKTNRSKEELTTDYLMGKDMAPEEEEEALSTLKIMPSTESIVSAAEQICIFSPPQTPLHIQGNVKTMTTTRHPSFKNMNTIHTNLKKSSAVLHPSDFKKDLKKIQKEPVQNEDVYLHLSIFSINIYRTIKSLQNYTYGTYIVQCYKDQEPYKSLRFISRHMDDNVVKFKNSTQSTRLEGSSVKCTTIKACVRLLSERIPIVLGETKQMLDWTGFSNTLNVTKCIKVPIWSNDKITGHMSLSYEFSKTPTIQKYEETFSKKRVEHVIKIDDLENKPIESNIFKSVTIAQNNEEDYEDGFVYQTNDQSDLYSKLYPEKYVVGSQQFSDERLKKEPIKATKEKGIQTSLDIRTFNKCIQTSIRTFNVGVQVDGDELEDPLDKTICCDVQNIFRCTHEFTFYVEKKCDSTFNYLTYTFPECVTNNLGKVITCCRMFRSFGNTNILHLISLPTTISLDTYFHNYYKKAAIVLNLHQDDDNSPGKVSLLVSHLVDMANEFNISHVHKKLTLTNNLARSELSQTDVHVKIHYKRVYHTFPSPENPCVPQKSVKKKLNVIVDLTESDSEDTSPNKTYTLLEHNNKFIRATAENSTQTDQMPVKMSLNCNTQTENDINQQCITIIDDNNFEKKIENTATQTDAIVVTVKKQNNLSNTKTGQQKKDFCKVNNNTDTIKAKVTIIGGYHLPMVKLYGDTSPSAPTTYVIMENYGRKRLITSSVVEHTNPMWNSEWNIELPKNNLIEGKWLILELWCKKYKNEYAGHDPERDMRLGFILINLCTLEFDYNQTGGFYDVISETEERYGQIKILVDLQCDENSLYQNIDAKKIDHVEESNTTQKLNDDPMIELLGEVQIENNFRIVKNSAKFIEEKHDYIDLTEDTPQQLIEPTSKNNVAKSSLQDCFFKNNNKFDTGTISSVTSWTSSSDDILCSNNSRIINDILNNETKINRIIQIIQG